MGRESALVYVVKQGAATLGEASKLSKEDRETLKKWAEEEMDAFGL